MAGRPKDPNTDFKVILHVHRSYRYAATVPYEPDPKKPGKMRRRYVFWGSVTDDLHFIPNQRYLFATSEERDRLIFPKEWDMSEAEHKLARKAATLNVLQTAMKRHIPRLKKRLRQYRQKSSSETSFTAVPGFYGK